MAIVLHRFCTPPVRRLLIVPVIAPMRPPPHSDWRFALRLATEAAQAWLQPFAPKSLDAQLGIVALAAVTHATGVKSGREGKSPRSPSVIALVGCR